MALVTEAFVNVFDPANNGWATVYLRYDDATYICSGVRVVNGTTQSLHLEWWTQTGERTKVRDYTSPPGDDTGMVSIPTGQRQHLDALQYSYQWPA